jgi:hypothetical protein
VLDNIKVDYIVLQSVEREFVNRGLLFNKKNKINNDSLTRLINKHKEKALEVVKEKTEDKFFRRETLALFLNSICYNLDDNAYSSKAYKVKTKKNLFSADSNNLLFFHDDYKAIKVNNNLDFYYDEIENKDKYTKPLFFDNLRNLNKQYIYIDSKKILKRKTKNIKDVYFFDDTHWSPIASKIIANAIKSKIEHSK